MSGMDYGSLTIRTPEGVEFRFQLAGPVSRFLAWAIDTLVVIAATIITLRIAVSFIRIAPELLWAMTILAIYTFWITYSMALEWFWRGQTLGKRIMRLRVMDEQGLKLQFSQIVIRNILRFADSLPFFYLLGGIVCLLSRANQRLGDYAANTIVIREDKIGAPDIIKTLPGKFNSFRQYPHLAARLRQNISPEAAKLALQTLHRRDGLDPDARLEVFAEMAAYFKALVTFPEEATFGLSDENCIRNVLDIVYGDDAKSSNTGK